MSVDYRLMFVYHGSMMLMMVLGQAVLSFKAEILAVFALASILVSISMKHRSSTNWRWPGVGAKEVLSAIGTAVLIAFFLGSAWRSFPLPIRMPCPSIWLEQGLACSGS